MNCSADDNAITEGDTCSNNDDGTDVKNDHVVGGSDGHTICKQHQRQNELPETVPGQEPPKANEPAAADHDTDACPGDNTTKAGNSKEHKADAKPEVEIQQKRQSLPYKRKRNNSSNDKSDLMDRLFTFQHFPNSLRIPASLVSALCGLHPFQNLPQVLFDLVYQSYLGQKLLEKDAKALGLTLVDAKTHDQESLLNIASIASDQTKELAQQVLDVSEGKLKLHSVDQVQSLQSQLKSNATQALKDGKLSKKQVDSLLSSAQGHVYTGFGTMHEEEALDVYERRVGCCVRERNAALMEWKFRRLDRNLMASESNNGSVDMGEMSVTAVPIGSAQRRGWEFWNNKAPVAEIGNKESVKGFNDKEEEIKSPKIGSESKPIEIAEDHENGVPNNSCGEDVIAIDAETKSDVCHQPYQKERPFFTISGAVDGIRDELYLDTSRVTKPIDSAPSATNGNPTNANKTKDDGDENALNKNYGKNESKNEFSDDDDDDQWTLRPIIVECKHRMAKAQIPPPLYDQIQTCLYCHMYDVEEADLIQVIRRRSSRDNSGQKEETSYHGISKECTETDSNGAQKCKNHIEITISRISLHDPLHNHQHHWTATILPRLASYVDAVYNVRKDDGKRYRLLMALMQCQEEETMQENRGKHSEKDAWDVLWDECPWLLHCDTAYGRPIRRF